MEPPKFDKSLSTSILDDSTNRYCEIYLISNILNGKKYIGQAVSHILNHKKYRPYGYKGRFRCHISEAYSNKKNQCHYLNNAIRKYGINNFESELIEYCSIENANDRETFYINQMNTIFPNGYNLKIGGKVFIHCDESKKRVSNGVKLFYKDKRYEKFAYVKNIDEDIEKYIRPLLRNNSQYGWYVYIESKKTDFGGVHISLEESKNSALEFIQELKNRLAKHLVAGNPLEPLLPLTYGNVSQELG
jgi:hypothetical protein